MLEGNYRYLAQERVIYGRAAARAVAEEAERLKAKRVFVATGRTLNRATPIARAVAEGLGAAFAGVFDECVEHTPRPTVVALAAALRAARADLVVALGGGTVIDTVKMALLCLAQDVRDVDALDSWHVRVAADGTRQSPAMGSPPFRQIAIPTTLSGAEFSDLAGCSDTRRGIKQAFTLPEMSPLSVILDPAVTTHTPERLWLSTGIRAVDHAVESVCSIEAEPYVDATCLEALRMFGRSLPENKAQPNDLEARLQSQIAVWLAASGLNRVAYGASHGIGHVLGAAWGVPHGITSCVLLPAVLAYNESTTAEPQRLIAAALGAPTDSAAKAVRRLIESIGLPSRLRDVPGADRSAFADLARKALDNLWVRTNPRRIAGADQVVAILDLAW